MFPFVSHGGCFNVPIAIYNDGSYFGDNDVLQEKREQRSHTAICAEDCQLYTINNDQLKGILGEFQDIQKLMIEIAQQKQNLYLVINEKLKKKYKSRKLVEDLFHEKKDLDYTFYISLKRENMKQLNATKKKVGQLPKKRKT